MDLIDLIRIFCRRYFLNVLNVTIKRLAVFVETRQHLFAVGQSTKVEILLYFCNVKWFFSILFAFDQIQYVYICGCL